MQRRYHGSAGIDRSCPDHLANGSQIAPIAAQHPAFALDEAYRVTAAVRRLREARGEMPVGRKIGFTNRSTWSAFAPMCGHVFDGTMHDLSDIGETFSLAGLSEPRIEPEIVFRLVAVPAPDMDEAALLACIDLIAHGWVLLLFAGEKPTVQRLAKLEALARQTRDSVGDRVTPYLVLSAAQEYGSSQTLLDPAGTLHHEFGARNGLVALIRPDGYLGYRGQPGQEMELASYLARVYSMRVMGDNG